MAQIATVNREVIDAMAEARTRVPKTVEKVLGYYSLTGADVSRVLGLNPQTVHNKLSGRSAFRHEEIVGLARWLATPIDVLLRLEPDDALRWVIDHPDVRPEYLKNR
jgi:hypothetical protein